MYYILLKYGIVRNTFINTLNARGIHVINGGSYNNTLEFG